MLVHSALRQTGFVAFKRQTTLAASKGIGFLRFQELSTSMMKHKLQQFTATSSESLKTRSCGAHGCSNCGSCSSNSKSKVKPTVSTSHTTVKPHLLNTSSHHALATQLPMQHFHTSSYTLKTDTKEQILDGALTPSIRDAILSDLKSVDADGNGRIDSEELKELLRKHGESFSEDEILELSELFYASLGASSVKIDQFVEALDGVMLDLSKSTGGEKATSALKRKFKTHPLGVGTCASEYMYAKSHGTYTKEELDVKLTHLPPVSLSDKTAFLAVKCVRFAFDIATGWNNGALTQDKILNRAIFLETIAAIPGMVAAIIRHFRSLRNMTRDGGMLNLFLEEAQNERMHLLTFIRMKDPGYLFRASVIGSQFGFGTFFLAAYVISPAWCHRFVGYVEEEACHTYTTILDAIEQAPEDSDLAEWRTADAPKIAKGYWHLGENGTVYDVMLAVRADEAEHRDVNHEVSGLTSRPGLINPLYDPRDRLDGMLKKYVEDMMKKNAKGSFA